ncbi:GAF domain-containing protein [Pseudarthrobacter sp. fls2-241-R2A-127]|uniref:GAF domain-containing protein n=1 Tax=Pseudarthrobacter sp. fls2-241-R2A-127 TaxID=3040303 RepID=UPI00255638A3|nr:GAF domain-containing protein [Pseudarthrobacter sp. fls2-241-R2A-127]
MLQLRREHQLQRVMPALQDLLADDSSSGRHLLVLTDATGEILWRVGSREALHRADRLEFSEGADWSEAGIGTNAISEALVTGAPVQLFSAEHLVRTHHDWACTAAPITDPLTGGLLGVLDVSGPLDTISADTLRMVRCAVRAAESLLGTPDGGTSLGAASPVHASRQAVQRAGVVVERLELLGDKPAAVFTDGSGVPLTLRRAEILALLDSRSQGWSAEELAYELRGDAGTPHAIRTEMFRVRSMLGDAVESNPYRLAGGLAGCSDSGRVLRLLREGQVAEALEAYPAPLLSRSGVLAVQLLRDQLDLAVGAAVRASGTPRCWFDGCPRIWVPRILKPSKPCVGWWGEGIPGIWPSALRPLSVVEPPRGRFQKGAVSLLRWKPLRWPTFLSEALPPSTRGSPLQA